MTIDQFKDKVEMERVKAFPKSECNMEIKTNIGSETKAIIINCVNADGSGKEPNAIFWIDLPGNTGDELPEKLDMDLLVENPKMGLRRTKGSSAKVLRMLYRNFEIMRNAQVAQ